MHTFLHIGKREWSIVQPPSHLVCRAVQHACVAGGFSDERVRIEIENTGRETIVRRPSGAQIVLLPLRNSGELLKR